MVAGPVRAALHTRHPGVPSSLSWQQALWQHWPSSRHNLLQRSPCRGRTSMAASVANGHQQTPQHTLDSDFLHLVDRPESQPVRTYLVLLNYSLPKQTAKLWQQSCFTICADGGTNRLHDSLPWMLGLPESEAAAVRAKYLPQAIIGDLDSIRPEVRSFYLDRGVRVMDLSHDQDTTDLGKCLMFLEEKLLSEAAGGNVSTPGAAQSQAAVVDGVHPGQAESSAAHFEVVARGAAAEAASSAAAAASAASGAAGHPATAAAEKATAAAVAAVQAASAATRAASAASAAASQAAQAAAAATAAAAAAASAGSQPSTVAATAASSPCSSSSSPPAHHIIVVGALGGRLDHMLSNLNALYQFPHLNITLWGDGNLVRLVRTGTTLIRPARDCEGPACGLVPLGGPATCTSSGLRWNLDNTVMQVAGLISTCNIIDSDEIWVTTDRELLWMTEVKET